MSDPKPTPKAAPAPSKWYDSTLLTIALLIFLWPIGMFALFKNRKLGGFGKFVIGGGITFGWLLFIGGAGFGGYYLYKHPEIVEKYVPNLKSNPSSPFVVATSDAQIDTVPATTTPPAETKIDGTAAAQNPLPAPDAPKVDPAKDEAARQAKLAEDAKAKQLEETKAKEAADLAEREKVEREKAEQAKKASAELAEKEAADFNRRKKEESTRLEAAATALRKQADMLVTKRKSEVLELEKALEDYNAATLLLPQLQNMEDAFRTYLKEKYNSTDFDDEKFNAFFTPDYLRNYNAQITRQQQGILGYVKILRTEITKNETALTKLTTDVEAANRANTSAGLQRIDPPPANPELEKRLEDLTVTANTLRERVVTLGEIKEKLGVKAVAQVTPQPQNPNPPTPPVVPSPLPVAEPVPLKTAPQPPVQPKIEPLAVAPAAIATADIQGNWTRGDGKVIWGFETGGILIVRDKKPIRGTWSFDEKTSVLSVVHSGVPFRFTVSKDRDQLTITGGANGNTSLRFNKR